MAKLNEEINFSLEATKFCLVLRSTLAVPTQTVFSLRVNTFLVGKSFCFSTEWLRFVACWFSFTLRWIDCVKIKLRSVSKIPFQTPFEAGKQFNAGVLSQSASSSHALLITKSALLIKEKCPLSSLSFISHTITVICYFCFVSASDWGTVRGS